VIAPTSFTITLARGRHHASKGATIVGVVARLISAVWLIGLRTGKHTRPRCRVPRLAACPFEAGTCVVTLGSEFAADG